MTRLRNTSGPGFTRDEYLQALKAGYFTGFWDDDGVPAPWPDDFENWQPAKGDPVTHKPGEPPF